MSSNMLSPSKSRNNTEVVASLGPEDRQRVAEKQAVQMMTDAARSLAGTWVLLDSDEQVDAAFYAKKGEIKDMWNEANRHQMAADKCKNRARVAMSTVIGAVALVQQHHELEDKKGAELAAKDAESVAALETKDAEIAQKNEVIATKDAEISAIAVQQWNKDKKHAKEAAEAALAEYAKYGGNLAMPQV